MKDFKCMPKEIKGKLKEKKQPTPAKISPVVALKSKKTNEIVRGRYEIDAAGKAVGRVAVEAAKLLHGKNRADFTSHIDAGGFVTIINAGQVKFTGRKLAQKDYHHHTMSPGGLRTISMKKVFDKNPAEVMRRAVNGMLPKNKQRGERLKRLTIKA